MTSTPAVPLDQQRTADSLFSGLGEFWTRIYSDADFLRDYCRGSSELAAQVYLELLECAAMLGLPNFPVFKRTRIVPVVLRKSQRGLATGGNLYLGRAGIMLGPQDGTDYREGETFHLGGSALPMGIVGYPVGGAAIAGQLGYACNSLMLPTRVLARNVDYRVDGTDLWIVEEHDPFEHLELYPHRTVFNPTSGENDVELVLWLTDVLYDRGWLGNSYGRIVGYEQPGGEVYHKQLMALWSLRTAGSSLLRVRITLADLFGVAVVRNDSEVVESVVSNADGSMHIITDLEVHAVGVEEQLLAGITVGSVLQAGDYLTDTLRLYTSMDTRRFYASNGHTLDQFLSDVPRLYIPRGLFGVPGMRAGFVPGWESADLTYEGATESGLPKLKFEMTMDPADEATYWNSVWAACERDSVNLITALDEFVSNTHPTMAGTVIGKINPMKFFMDNFLGVNFSVLVVDFDAISAYSTSLEQLGRLADLLPAHTMLLTVLRTTLDDEELDLSTARDSLATSAGKRRDVEEMNITAGSEECLQTRWVRQCS